MKWAEDKTSRAAPYYVPNASGSGEKIGGVETMGKCRVQYVKLIAASRNEGSFCVIRASDFLRETREFYFV